MLVWHTGREMAFLDRGREVLNKVVAAVADFGKIEMEPRMEGAYMRIMIAPSMPEPVKKPKPISDKQVKELESEDSAEN